VAEISHLFFYLLCALVGLSGYFISANRKSEEVFLTTISFKKRL